MQGSLFDDLLHLDSITENQVAAAVASGALLLTASSRHAIDWKRRIITASPQAVVETPRVTGWSEWLAELVRKSSSMPVSLNRMQENLLWEKVLRDDLSDGSQSASSIRGLAKHASEAYAILKAYRIPLDELESAGEEAEALLRWIDQLQDKLKQASLAGRMLAADQVERLLPELDNLVDSPQIIVDGFERFTPEQEELLTSLQRSGVKLFEVDQRSAEPAVKVVSCVDEVEEFYRIGQRIGEILDAQPQHRIALLTSDAVTDTSSLQRLLNKRLIPTSIHQPLNPMQAVNMPSGALGDTPMIQQLLFVLGLAGRSSFSFSDFSKLLFSPWLKGFEAESDARAELDRVLRQKNRHHISLQFLLESQLLEQTPELKSVLTSLLAWKQKRYETNDWVKRVHKLLQDSGFVLSGFEEISRNNHEIRLMNSFRDVLSSLVCIDAVSEPLSWSRFLSVLRSTCSDMQVKLPVCYPNVVMMPLNQVTGLRFDHVFVIGFDQQEFPLMAKPKALLPLPLQQKYRVGMSSAPFAFESSHFIWQQLLHAAPVIEISYAQQRAQQDRDISPFAKGIESTDAVNEEVEIQQLELEAYVDTPAVQLQSDEVIRGGTSLIRDQSACPFRAFARHRLAITELGDTVPGIEPATKGSLLHLALEFIWQRLKSAEALHLLDAQQRLTLVDESITFAWQQNRGGLSTQIRSVEVRRMQAVLLEWLELESRRPPFQVLAIEKAYQLALPSDGIRQFAVHIKADRMDRDADGRRVLIDYKTGAKQSFGKWLGERMEEPQLPLYAIAAELNAEDAVCYGRVRSGEIGFEGLSGDDVGIRGITPCDGKRGTPDDWPALLEVWQENLNALAQEVVDGRCDVSPRNEKACSYCKLEAVCRVEERGFDAEGDQL